MYLRLSRRVTSATTSLPHFICGFPRFSGRSISIFFVFRLFIGVAFLTISAFTRSPPVISLRSVSALAPDRPRLRTPTTSTDSRNSRAARFLCVSLGVLAGQLWRETFKPLLLSLQPCLSCPGALEIVADLHVQPAERLSFELDQVAVLKWIQTAVIRAAGEDVARFERMDRAHPFDAARNLVRHVAGVVALHQRAVVPQPHLKIERVFN